MKLLHTNSALALGNVVDLVTSARSPRALTTNRDKVVNLRDANYNLNHIPMEKLWHKEHSRSGGLSLTSPMVLRRKGGKAPGEI